MKSVMRAFLVAALAIAGCINWSGDDDGTGWVVEVGQCSTCPGPYQGQPFAAFSEGDPAPVVLGPQGNDMLLVDLRVVVPPGGAGPGSAVIQATAVVGDLVVGGFRQTGGNWIHVPSKGGAIDYYLLKDFRVVFQSEPCCFMCSSVGAVTITVGGAPVVRRQVLFRRTSCPDLATCCWDSPAQCPGGGDGGVCPLVSLCPNPAIALRCSAPTSDGGVPSDGAIRDLAPSGG